MLKKRENLCDDAKVADVIALGLKELNYDLLASRYLKRKI